MNEQDVLRKIDSKIKLAQAHFDLLQQELTAIQKEIYYKPSKKKCELSPDIAARLLTQKRKTQSRKKL